MMHAVNPEPVSLAIGDSSEILVRDLIDLPQALRFSLWQV
jgi:hypothetical protein